MQRRRRRDRAARCCNHDRREGEIAIGDDESGSRTIGFGVRREQSVLGGSVLGCDDLTDGAIGATNELGLGFSGFVGVGLFWVFWVLSLSLSLSLSLYARALLPLSLSLSSLCFSENSI